MTVADRAVLLIINQRRAEATAVARDVIDELRQAGIDVRMSHSDAEATDHQDVSIVDESDPMAAVGCELAVVLGGDGTILRAAEMVHASAVPVLGVNLGHVGFLAEAERNDVATVVAAVVQRQWTVEERLTLDVRVYRGDDTEFETFALNEVSIEKTVRERMLDLIVEVDGRPLSRWGCDGVICATPTGSTAYAFSAGGPVVWPDVEALLLVPISAHALFSRPLVVAPSGTLAVELPVGSEAVLWADGRRGHEVQPGSRIEVTRHSHPVRIARLNQAPFTDRLVAKFQLPVNGWRGLGGEAAG
ncbi:MAG: NAD kinase [Actinomycetes bacterium]